MNDILCIHKDRDENIWVGSSYGLTKLSLLPNGEYDYKNFNENEGSLITLYMESPKILREIYG